MWHHQLNAPQGGAPARAEAFVHAQLPLLLDPLCLLLHTRLRGSPRAMSLFSAQALVTLLGHFFVVV